MTGEQVELALVPPEVPVCPILAAHRSFSIMYFHRHLAPTNVPISAQPNITDQVYELDFGLHCAPDPILDFDFSGRRGDLMHMQHWS